MKYNKLFSALSSLIIFLAKANASRGDFYGENDNRPELFKILDDHVGTIKINLDEETWTTMKEKTQLAPWNAGSIGEKFSTENATMVFEVEGTEYKVELQPGEFKFSLSGKFSRNFVKPGYNIKLKKGDIYDVKLLRLRSNIRDVSLMREKLSSDILYKMGVPTTSTNYVNVEVNNENLGIYILTNKIKKDFIKRYFNESSTNNLYECEKDYSRFEDNTIVENCDNIKDELVDKKDDIQNLVDAVNNAKTVEDIRDIIDVDAVLKSFAFEFVTLSWDHFFLLSHNYFWYKKPDDGKWMMLLNDFDETFAQDIWPSYFTDESIYYSKPYIPDLETINLPNLSVRDLEAGHKLTKLLILDDDTRFREIVADVVKTVFNPKVLNPRIDEIADLIRDDVAASRQFVGDTGRYAGCINALGFDPKWNMTHFEDGINYVSWVANPNHSRSYALKFFIEERFRYLCHTYAIDPETLELIQPRPVVSFWGIINKYKLSHSGDFYNDEHVRFTFPDLVKEQYMQEEYNANPEKNKEPSDYQYLPTYHELQEQNSNSTQPAEPTQTSEPIQSTPSLSEPVTPTPEVANPTPETCWSEELGYPCCTSSCHVYSFDTDGQWGYEDNHWCGIPSSCDQEKCWSKKLGYNCCQGCQAYEVDSNGKWGYENNEWCGIIEENCQ
jgi:hypothetical protein